MRETVDAERPALKIFRVTWANGAWNVAGRDGADPAPWQTHSSPPEVRLDRAADTAGTLEQWFRSSEFGQRWSNRALPGDDHNVFVLDGFPDGIWQIPWELLITLVAETGNHHRIGIVRAHGRWVLEAPDTFDEPLRSLVLTGSPEAEPGAPPLQLDANVQGIRDAWSSLVHDAREHIASPVAAAVERGNIVDLLDEHKPHLLWFAGHGQLRNETELLFNDGWVTATDLLHYVDDAKHVPLYAGFWACDTGVAQEETDLGQAFTPDLFVGLAHRGVLSVMVTQAPISDVGAQILARDVFQHLAGGSSLTQALTVARADLYDDERLGAGGAELDWATPVLWVANEPVAALAWDSQADVRFQSFAERLLRTIALIDDPAVMEAEQPAREAEVQRAQAWCDAQRTWVRSEADAANRKAFTRALRAMMEQSDVAVIALSGKDHSDLQAWAKRVLKRLRPGELRREVTAAFGATAASRDAGWEQLTSLDNVCLAIVDPPPQDATWFWGPLNSGAAQVVVLDDVSEVDAVEGWELDAFDVLAAPDDLDAIVQRAPRLANALAVLQVPVRREHIELVQPGDEVQRLDDWVGSSDLLVHNPWGLEILATTPKNTILAAMTTDEMKTAHWDAASFLARRRQSTETVAEILEHLVAAEVWLQAFGQAAALIGRLVSFGEPAEAVAVVERLDRSDQLPVEAALTIGAAYTAVLRTEEAQRWLDSAAPESDTDQAWKASLQMQVDKARGTPESYESAREQITEAIRLARQAGDRAAVRRYRQDEALLLQHPFRSPAEATTIYTELIDEIRQELDTQPYPQPDLERDLAVVLRNNAEALRSMGQGNPVADLREAHELVENSMAPIRAEIRYEWAKALKDQPAEERKQLQACLDEADLIGHVAMRAIAKNRLFWLGEFDADEWQARAAELAQYENNAWAARTLINGRLRAAKALEEDDPEAALEELQANRDLFERSTVATGGTRDRRRIAQTFAGLTVVSGEPSYWEDHRSRDPSASTDGAEALWKEDVT